jgi:methylamine dehydrogenase heavy chain
MRARTLRARATGIGFAALCLGGLARADVPIEIPGEIVRMPPLGAHHVVVADLLLRRSGIVDLDSGAFLGMFSTGFLTRGGVFPPGADEFFVPETYYSRGSRGERTDVVTIYESQVLAPVGEIQIPPKRAMNVLASGNDGALDGGRFVVVHNMTPATSVSVVDVEARTFVEEIPTPGCALVYPAGPRRFFSLCANGSLRSVTLDAEGRRERVSRSDPFFDPRSDPITEKGVRVGDTWIFASFEGYAVPIDVSGDEPRPGERWSLLDDADRADSWRIGGSQHLAAHEGLGRLYSLVHQGGVDSHKDPGTELWVYDLARRERVQRIALEHPGFELLGTPIEFGRSWPWPLNRLSDLLIYGLAPSPGISHVVVTRGADPLIVTGSSLSGSLALYDAETGDFQRRVATGNFTVQRLQVPWGRK